MKKGLLFFLLVCASFSVSAQKTVAGVQFSACLNKQIPQDFYKGKFLLLDFWAPWSTPSVESFKELEALQQKYRNNTAIIFATMTAGPKPQIDSFFDQHKGTLPGFFHLIDDNRSTGIYYDIEMVPFILVFSPSGKVAFSGRLQQLTGSIDSLLKVK